MESPAPLIGVKRKRDELTTPSRIRALDPTVVNKIAAGEIIVAPVNALKEMIENAVDAGATNIEVLVRDGGLKLLQITDNGSGINRDDLSILCERFTTSKLKDFEDLHSIATYGFRGEALASISHIAHLSVTTKTADSNCAWKAHYADGKLTPAKPGQSPDPKPCAGRQGTQIVVEDLFFNMPMRKRAFRSPSDEHTKILELVAKYGVHCKNVAFSCKKYGDAGVGQSVPANASVRERIRILHSSALTQDLIELNITNSDYSFKSEGLVSNANHVGKRTTLLLFINHRSVESTAVKRAIDQTYSTFLPKGGKPFIYLSIEIDPARVDVNVHPTKREVNFLYEDEIIDLICEDIRIKLGNVDHSRTFMTQTILSGGKALTISRGPTMPDEPEDEDMADVPQPAKPKPPTEKIYENNLVRTDPRSRKITGMLSQARPALGTTQSLETTIDEMEYTTTEKEPTMCRLNTIKELRAEVRADTHHELTEVFTNLTFVGVVDDQKRLAAIQSGVKLLLIDYGMIAAEFFYQLGLTDFGNFGTFELNPPLKLKDILIAGIEQIKGPETDQTPSQSDIDDIVKSIHDQLVSRAEMLNEYFSLQISDEGNLLTLPLMIKGYTPSLAKLPNFLLRLGPHVDWTDEKRCFDTFLRELASFYVPESILIDDKAPENVQVLAKQRQNTVLHAIEHVLIPAFKTRLVATTGLVKATIEIANLKGLYKVFERC